MVALVAVIVPIVAEKAYAAESGHIAYLVPAESALVEAGGGEILWVLMAPTAFTTDAAHIAYLLPAESGEAEAGGGEAPRVQMAPTEFTNDRIELLIAK